MQRVRLGSASGSRKGCETEQVDVPLTHAVSKMRTLNFDMNTLRTMVIGVDPGGFSHAALRLNRSPSAVSMQLRKLERQAGQRLFQRGGRGLVLTQAGELLLQQARRVLALNDAWGKRPGRSTTAAQFVLGFPRTSPIQC